MNYIRTNEALKVPIKDATRFEQNTAVSHVAE